MSKKELMPMIKELTPMIKKLTPMIQYHDDVVSPTVRKEVEDCSDKAPSLQNTTVVNDEIPEPQNGLNNFVGFVSSTEYSNVSQDYSHIYAKNNLDKQTFLENYAMNDTGRAERFLNESGVIVRYVFDEVYFIEWTGTCWKKIHEKVLYKRIVDFTKVYSTVAIYSCYRLDALESGNNFSIKNILEIIKSKVGISSSELNSKKGVLCLSNGVYDFNLGCLMEHKNYFNNYITYQLDFEYIEGYHDRILDKFLLDIMVDNENVDCLQRLFGYAILGNPCEQIMCMLVGDGANGKSTLIGSIQALLKELTTTVNVEYFMGSNKNSNPEAPSPVAASFKDKLMVFTSEGKANSYLNDALIKKYIGGGLLTGRKLHKDIIKFESKFTIFFDTNYLPHFSESGYSMERRVVVIPFPVTFPKEKQNPNLNKILESASCQTALLVWLIEGAMKYLSSGLHYTERVTNATADYLRSEDTVRMFIEECTVYDNNSRLSFAELYAAYVQYCENNMLFPEDKIKFSKSKTLDKYTTLERNNATRYRRGLALKRKGDM